jgi:putative transposase
MPILLNPQSREILSIAWKDVAKRYPFTTDAICLLPNHIHVLMTLPEHDCEYSMRIREIKRLYTKRYLANIGENIERNLSHIHKREASIWQRRFWEHTIRDEQDYENHFDYIHYNPVKHGLVDNVSLWQWSSFHRYVKLGVYEPNWGENFTENNKINFGE